MNRILIIFLIVFINTCGFAALEYKELLHIPWGNAASHAGVRIAPGGQFGPTAFRVSGQEISILDSEKQRVMFFESGKYRSDVPYPLPFADDFTILSQNHMILLNENEVFELERGIMQKIYTPQSPRTIITGLNTQNGQTSALLSDQTRILTNISGLQKPVVQNAIKINKTSFYQADIRVNDTPAFSIESNLGNLGVVKHIGNTPAGNRYFYIEYLRQQVPLIVERTVQLIDPDGTILNRITIPALKHSYIFREFDVDERGNLYHMISGQDGIHIIAWYNNDQEAGSTDYTYPEKFESDHHYNNSTVNLAEPEDIGLSKSGTPESINASVTRDEALEIGDTYVKHVWNAEAKNLTNGRIKDPDGIEIETPGWLSLGQNTKIPYKWGGFWTLAGFDQGLLDGKYAGDIATSGVSGYCVGVDCSGFVSRCWKLSTHYSTRMMDDNITIAYDSWDKIGPGDAVHKVGHVRMFVDYNTDGSLLVVESAGRDWRVSYHSYNYSDLTSYTPRYYINMEGSPNLLAKPVFNHVVTTDSVRLSWQISDQSDINGFNLYLTLDGTNWEYVTAENTLQQSSRAINFAKDSDLACYYRLTARAADNPSKESYPSDTYGYRYISGTPRVLIVDSFDRLDGSYGLPYHTFAMQMGQALEAFQVSFETTDNDDVIAQSVELADYDAVFWILGDESVRGESFSDAEQTLVKDFLKQGGKLFVSGSEIAWDLDNKGSETDKDFIHNYLCAQYYQDDSQSYTVHGITGVFSDLTIQYDDGTHGIYEEDYPDALNVSNNSQAILKYDNDKIAAVAKTGIFPGGSAQGSIIYAGFPFETIYQKSQREKFVESILNYFGIIATGIDNKNSEIVRDFTLHGNYPNPFNPNTTFHFTIPEQDVVNINIFNMLGQNVSTIKSKTLSAGTHKISFDGSHLASGTYLYLVRWRDQQLIGKMQLIK